MAGETGFEFSEGLTINVKHLNVMVVIPSKFIEQSDEGDKMLKLVPNRWRQIATLLTSHSDERYRTAQSFKSLFRAKSSDGKNGPGRGKAFLRWVQKQRDIAFRLKYQTQGKSRFKPRGKVQRARAQMAGMIEVALPSIGLAQSITAQMKINVYRKNGGDSLVIKIDADVLTYLALGLDHFIHNDDGHIDPDSASENDIDNEVATEDEASQNDEDEAADAMDVGEGDLYGSSTDSVANTASLTSTPVRKPKIDMPVTASPVVRSSQIFAAFQKAAEAHAPTP